MQRVASWIGVAVLGAVLAPFARAHAQEVPQRCQPAWAAGAAVSDEQLEACVPKHSPLFGFAGVTGVFPEGGGAVAQINSNAFGPLFVATRIRLTNAALHVDAEVGLVFSNWRAFAMETPGGARIATEVVARSQWVLSGGLFAIHAFEDSGSGSVGRHVGPQLGLQWHSFNDLGAYSVFQLHAIRTLGDDAAFGASTSFQWELWFARQFSWGSELGFVFASSTSMWVTLDIAYSFGS